MKKFILAVALLASSVSAQVSGTWAKWDYLNAGIGCRRGNGYMTFTFIQEPAKRHVQIYGGPGGARPGILKAIATLASSFLPKPIDLSYPPFLPGCKMFVPPSILVLGYQNVGYVDLTWPPDTRLLGLKLHWQMYWVESWASRFVALTTGAGWLQIVNVNK